MSNKLVLPRPTESYDSRAESQRNLLIEQAFSRISVTSTSGGAGTSGIFDGGTSSSTYVGAAVIDAGSSA